MSWKLKWALLIACRPSVCLSVKFSYFYLLQNHWANFYQTLHKASMVKFSNEVPRPFQKGDNFEIAEILLMKFKYLFLQYQLSNFNHTWHKASLGKWNSSLFKWRPTSFSKGRLLRNNVNTLTKFENLLI